MLGVSDGMIATPVGDTLELGVSERVTEGEMLTERVAVGERVVEGEAGKLASPQLEMLCSPHSASATPRVLMGRNGLTEPTLAGPFHPPNSDVAG